MRQRRIFSLLMCLGSCIAVSAQTLPLDSCIRKGKLANGLTYYIRHNAQTPGQADFYIAQRVGSILEQPDSVKGNLRQRATPQRATTIPLMH